MKLLMIEDDSTIIEALKEVLTEFEFISANTLHQARNCLKDNYHLILLDIQLPDGNGIDFIKEIRQVTTIPIIFLSVIREDSIIARGLDLGADDYVIKPFNVTVLTSRIKSVLRRYYGKNESILTIADLKINAEKLTIYKNDNELKLTPIETQLFFMLVNARGKILTRRYLLEQLWDQEEHFIEDNTLSVHIKRLKEKIGYQYIGTKRRVGYYFIGESYD